MECGPSTPLRMIHTRTTGFLFAIFGKGYHKSYDVRTYALQSFIEPLRHLPFFDRGMQGRFAKQKTCVLPNPTLLSQLFFVVLCVCVRLVGRGNQTL